MKSFCIKNNNEAILKYLQNEIQNVDLDDVYVSRKSFKYYNNIIVHYIGKDEALFISKLSKILTNCIMKFYEKDVIKRIVNTDYFYFDSREKECIYSNCNELLEDEKMGKTDNINNLYNNMYLREEKIFTCLTDYISENKFFILDGFVNFRLFEYYSLLSEYVDTAVNKFIIDKEYNEFIELLKSYIHSQSPGADIVHLIYTNSEPILMDDKQNILVYENQFEHPKYLSDITFSSNDYCLNALLNLLPNKIIIHLLAEEDEFVETLKLIFGKRLMICKECNICKTFSLLNVHQK